MFQGTHMWLNEEREYSSILVPLDPQERACFPLQGWQKRTGLGGGRRPTLHSSSQLLWKVLDYTELQYWERWKRGLICSCDVGGLGRSWQNAKSFILHRPLPKQKQMYANFDIYKPEIVYGRGIRGGKECVVPLPISTLLVLSQRDWCLSFML